MPSFDFSADVDESTADICRVCRMEGTPDRPLYYPCICTGSIKYIHQECLTQWLKYSKKEYCELCNYKYAFMPIYHPDMPSRLPAKDLVMGLVHTLGRFVRFWLHYTLVAIAWLGVVPLMACRIYRCLFTGSVRSLLTLPIDVLSLENLLFDCLQGGLVLALTLCTFISLIWLREQIVQAGLPQWIDHAAGGDEPVAAAAVVEQPEVPPADDGAVPGNEGEVEALVNDRGGVVDEVVVPPAGDGDGENEAAVLAEPAIVDNIAENDAAQDDNNWQPFDWNQGGEELTWERLLGLDGSLIFLEHVFWVIALNTLFVLVFAFSPYHIGHFVVIAFGLTSYVHAAYFEGLTMTLIGYFAIAVVLFGVQWASKFGKFFKAAKLLGMAYLVVKVFLLVLIEIGIFPLLCGVWLDVCSLSLFNATMKERLDSYHGSPGTSLFIHWLVGMVYVFYFASFVLVLREVLRSGVLWFLRNLNDPDFNPIQEMIQFPVYRHVKRFGASLAMFGVMIIIVVFGPIRLMSNFWSTILPYNISLSIEAPMSELLLELLLLQVVLPALLEQGHARQMLKGLVKRWCLSVGGVFGLAEYLLPAEDLRRNNPNAADAGDPVAEPVVADGAESSFKRPSYFALRVSCLLIAMALSFMLASLFCLSLPVFVGRELTAVVLGRGPIHELYTMACGLYVCWILLRVWMACADWLARGWQEACNFVRLWTAIALKCLVVSIALVGLFPLMFGVLFQLLVITPLRVSMNQSPIYFPWQDWAMGILHSKIICAVVMMGPDWWLKQVLERIYQDGLRNLSVRYVFVNLIRPVLTAVGLVITVPYVFAHSICPLLSTDFETQVLIQRQIYPCLLVVTVFVAFLCWQIQQFTRLIQGIRNDKYLVGQRLVNYEKAQEAAASALRASEDAENAAQHAAEDFNVD